MICINIYNVDKQSNIGKKIKRRHRSGKKDVMYADFTVYLLEVR